MTNRKLLDGLGKLAIVEGGIEDLRSVVMTLAVEGKLSTPCNADTPVARLIESIQKAQLVGGRAIRARTSSIKETPADSEATCTVPAYWSWVRFGELAEVVGGVTKGRKLKDRDTASYPYLRVANVQRGFLILSEMKQIEIPVDELSKYELQPGDVLLTEGGDWDKLGRACTWAGEITPCLHQNHVFRARPVGIDNLKMNSAWLELYCNSPVGRRYFQGAAKQTTNLASINMTQLRNCPVPVPPPEEQARALERVDQLMALCDELEDRQKKKWETSVQLNKAALNAVVTAPNPKVLKDSWKRVQDHFEVLYDLPENVKELRQTILQLAVMGKLVRQEPKDEPARTLLQRVDEDRREAQRRGVKRVLAASVQSAAATPVARRQLRPSAAQPREASI